jgi:hypothetical protein
MLVIVLMIPALQQEPALGLAQKTIAGCRVGEMCEIIAVFDGLDSHVQAHHILEKLCGEVALLEAFAACKVCLVEPHLKQQLA